MRAIVYILCLSFILFPLNLFSEVISQVVAVVGNRAITNISLDDEVAIIKQHPDQIPKGIGSLPNRVLDTMIDKLLVELEAEKESIIVSPERINNQIKKEGAQRGITDDAALKQLVTSQLKVSWEKYQEVVRERILTEELMQLKIKTPHLPEDEMKNWYNQNKKRIGDRYKFRMIRIPFNLHNAQDELRANTMIVEAKKIAITNFAKAVSLYSKDESAQNGGDMGWKGINEVAAVHPYLASLLVQTPVGQLSQEVAIEDSYYLLKVEAKQAITYTEAKDMIQGYLFREKQAESFKQWLKDARKTKGVKSFYLAIPKIYNMQDTIYLLHLPKKYTTLWTEDSNVLSIHTKQKLIDIFVSKIESQKVKTIACLEDSDFFKNRISLFKMDTIPYQSDLEAILYLFNTYTDINTIVFFDSITPLWDIAVVEDLKATHNQYKADFSFSENLPKGLVPTIIGRSLLEALSIQEPNFLVAPSLLTTPLSYYIEKNINKYHVEIHYDEPDLRMLRLDFSGKSIRSMVRIQRFVEKVENKNAPFIELEAIINNTPNILHTKPSYIEVELISDCNYACTFCPRQFTPQAKYILDRDEFDSIITFTKNNFLDTSICLGGMGEPLLHPNFLEYCQIILDTQEIPTLVIETNGFLLNTIVSLIEHKNFNKVKLILNINSFKNYGSIHGVPNSYLSIVEQNLKEWLSLVESRHGKVLLQNIYVQILKIEENEEEIDDFFKFTQDHSIQFLLQKYNTYNNLMPQKRVSDMTPLTRSFCWHLRRDLFIRANGDISFCKQDITNQNIHGNLKKDSLENSWNSIKKHWEHNYKEQHPSSPNCLECDEYFTFNL